MAETDASPSERNTVMGQDAPVTEFARYRFADDEIEMRSRIHEATGGLDGKGSTTPWTYWSLYVHDSTTGPTGEALEAVAKAVRHTILPDCLASTSVTRNVYTDDGDLIRSIEYEFRTVGDGRRLTEAFATRARYVVKNSDASASERNEIMTAEKPHDVFMERMATSPEVDPIRRVIAEFEREPELVAAAVLELIRGYLGVSEDQDHVETNHDSLCEAELIAEAGAYTPCDCADRLDRARQSEAAADAAMEAEFHAQ